MAWLITGNVITLLLVSSSQSVQEPVYNNPEYSGTCASIDYSTKCCPPGGTCQASDGNCRCSSDCHFEHLDDCCGDVFCHPEPRTCQDVGCCNSGSVGVSGCRAVFLYDENGDLLPSSQQCNSISNCPQTCAEAKFNPGFCKWQFKPMRETCRVYRGNCYCDPYCMCFGDCCGDVQVTNVSTTYFALSEECMRMYERFEQELKQGEDNTNENIYSKTQIQDVDDEEVYIQYVFAIHARVQQMRNEATAN